MSNYRELLSQFKRKLPGSSSGSESESPDSTKHCSKKLNFESDQAETEMEKMMTEMNRRFDSLQANLASKDDVKELKKEIKAEMDSFFQSVTDRLVALEEKVGRTESDRKRLEEEVKVLKQTNADLFGKLNSQSRQLTALRREQNDAEQHGRKWNLRIFNVAEAGVDEPEPTTACVRKLCGIFTDLVGVPVKEDDIELAHRVGRRLPGATRPRPIIARFYSRKKKDEVLTKRRHLKGNRNKIAIAEDLTTANYKLLKEAREHSATLDAWTSNGRITAKLKNGKTIQLYFDCDLDSVLRKEM